MAINSDEPLLIRKLVDKATQALYNNYPTYTQFLDLNEQSLFLSHLKEFPNIHYHLFGGYDESERKVVGFFSDDYHLDGLDYPIAALKIIPERTSDKLTHRDYLGSIMSLGIERFMIGDIICVDNGAYVFCIDRISDYILEQLVNIRNSSITVEKVDVSFVQGIKPNFDVIKGTVSSLRLDSIVKLGFSMSRGNALALIESGKVYINSKLFEKGSAKIYEGDIISIRGFGKMKVQAIGELTKKGRTFIELYKYK